MANNTLQRYHRIRKADNVDDQQDSAAILGALISSTTQEDLQVFLLSRLRQVIFGQGYPGTHHWNDDFLSGGVKSLRELSQIVLPNSRVGVSLVGPKNGINRVFRTTPDYFINDPSGNGKTIEVWHNGRRLLQSIVEDPSQGDFVVSESGGLGTGWDTVTLLTFAPVSNSGFVADYQLA